MTQHGLENAAHLLGPIIAESDPWGDPDDGVALAAIAQSPRLALVATSDEIGGGDRARLTRRFLNWLGRDDVPVVAGAQLTPRSRYWVMDGVVDAGEPVDTDMVERVLEVCWGTEDPVTWIGLGPMTNYAAVLAKAPQLADQLKPTQMGGWIDTYRNPERASHNLRLDPAAAGLALRASSWSRLIMSEHTNVPDIDVNLDHELYRRFDSSTAPWARLIAENYRRWFSAKFPHSWLGDPLTVAAALGEPVISFRRESLHIASDARLYRRAGGRQLIVSDRVDYPKFLRWLNTQLPFDAANEPPVGAVDEKHSAVASGEGL